MTDKVFRASRTDSATINEPCSGKAGTCGYTATVAILWEDPAGIKVLMFCEDDAVFCEKTVAAMP